MLCGRLSRRGHGAQPAAGAAGLTDKHITSSHKPRGPRAVLLPHRRQRRHRGPDDGRLHPNASARPHGGHIGHRRPALIRPRRCIHHGVPVCRRTRRGAAIPGGFRHPACRPAHRFPTTGCDHHPGVGARVQPCSRGSSRAARTLTNSHPGLRGVHDDLIPLARAPRRKSLRRNPRWLRPSPERLLPHRVPARIPAALRKRAVRGRHRAGLRCPQPRDRGHPESRRAASGRGAAHKPIRPSRGDARRGRLRRDFG